MTFYFYIRMNLHILYQKVKKIQKYKIPVTFLDDKSYKMLSIKYITGLVPHHLSKLCIAMEMTSSGLQI